MRRPVLLLVLLAVSAAGGAVAAGAEVPDATWYALASTAPSAASPPDVAATSPERLELELVVAGLATHETQSRGASRSVVEIPGAGVTAEPGKPRLPVLRYLLEVPPGADVLASLEPLDERVLRLADLGTFVPVLPVQLPVPKLPGAENEVPYVEDVLVYRADADYPVESVRVAERAILRGRHVALIEIHPVRYNPVAGTLRVWSSARLEVTFEGGRPEVAAREKRRLASVPFDRWLERTILAPPETAPRAAAGSGDGGALGMLVVVHDSFAAAIEPFVDWKRKSGYKVDVVLTSELAAQTDVAVKAEVQERYDDWSAPALSFLLLVGDTDFCPIHTGNGGGSSQVTDNWYACLEGTDYLPEIAVSRISTRTAAETAAVVDKLLTYERALFPTDGWTKLAGFIGTNDSGHIGLIEGTHNWCIDNYFTPNGYQPTAWSHGGASCDRHYNTFNATTAQIAASVNEGRSIVNYSGHGSSTGWEGPTSGGSYDQDDVRNNTNADMYPFVISNACVTGTLATTECFGETWQKAPDKGAIAFWGASNNSYWDEDDVLQRALYGNVFPMDSTPPIGVIVNETKLDLYDHYGATGSVAYYFDMYNLLSEPSLSLWTRRPRSLDVTYPTAHPIGESQFPVEVRHQGAPVAGALVAVRGAGVAEATYTDSSGLAMVALDPAPQAVGSLEVTVTGHDYRPHEGMAEVISPDTPWLVHRTHAVDDSTGGDGDGLVNPGEELVLRVTVENVGQQPGTSLLGTLLTSTPQWCEVLDGSAVYPDLLPDEQGESLPDHYRVRVDPAAPDGVVLGFDLAWTAAGGGSGTTSFGELVRAVDFSLVAHSIDDSASGNGNGVAGPGETVDLTLELRNAGHRDASGIAGVLDTDSPYVTILEDAASFPDLDAGESAASLPPPYRFSVASNAPDQEPVTFTLTLEEEGSGHAEVLVFDVPISSCATVASTDVPQPIGDNTSIESTLFHARPIEIGEVNVRVDITHTYQGDLRVTLRSPAGTQVVLHNRTGGSAHDIHTWYDTETAPAQPLSVLEGESAEGTWVLKVEDLAGGDTGTLDGWAIEVCGDPGSTMPMLEVDAHALDDEGACDPDGHADVGEVVRLDVRVHNAGWVAATGVEAALSSDAAVAVLNGPVPLGTIAPGTSAWASFDVLVGAVECLESASFVVDLHSLEGVWGGGFVERLEVDMLPSMDEHDVEVDGAEPAGWTHAAAVGPDNWSPVATRNHTEGGAWSWSASDQSAIKDDRLVMPATAIAGDTTLEFWQWVETEEDRDGGVLEISTDAGASWIDLGPYIVSGGYDAVLGGANPIAGRSAWTGKFTSWRHAVVDLASFAPATALVRWRFTCDGSASRSAWWVDDVMLHTSAEQCDVHACGVPGNVQITAVSREGDGVRLDWGTDPLCTGFRVWRSADATTASAFADVTSEDDDPTDATFLDASAGALVFWIVQASGPDGDGPWGHYGQ